jgi:hypothetical protein
MITPFSLSAALQALGVAQVFIGDPMTSGGMTCLGCTEGVITAQATQALNELTAPELTGNIPHQATATLDKVDIVCSLVMGDPTIYPKISPWGTSGGGHSSPQVVSTTGVLLVPLIQLGGGLQWNVGAAQWQRTAGNGVAAASGATAAPVNAIWLWRAVPSFAAQPYQYQNGGKVLTPITFTAMFDVSKTEGNKVYTIGDPRALAAPINVVL